MSSLKFEDLVASMLAAAKGVFDKRWPDIEDYAEPEFEKLARTLIQIQSLRARKKISEGTASVLLEMQKNTTRAVMLTLKGMGLVLIEEAINAALTAVKDIVNSALGFALL
ncbi:hypothetical protein D3C87_815010 [compost metagenome]|uniref:hypothetical protein n=1 Tax=Achromobacter sp. Root83 TaxID=1736602 RepID=UPI00070B2379|nr:hypothetical protein [Achromobacter sp. Root83]KRC85940.1 hypothetical protein ASE30_03015 [Achromobacter sp. Root83]